MPRRMMTVAFLLFVCSPIYVGFTGTDLLLPAVGRVEGVGAEFYTTVWITNTSDQPADIEMTFLAAGQSGGTTRA